jgi:dipeptidyl aminopeptidase/acylaminoacyl peptidase
MVLSRMLIASLLALSVNVAQPAASVDPSPPTVGGVRGRPDLGFPGGGRILFLPSRAPGYQRHGIGVVESDGTVRRFPMTPYAFPYWDPAAQGSLLVLSSTVHPSARSFEIVGRRLVRIGRWPSSDASFTYPSLDGRWLAYTPFRRNGHLWSGVLRIVERSSGSTRTIRFGELVPRGWAPDGRLLASPWNGGDLVLWDPTTGATTPFGPGRLAQIVWAPDGNRFAAVVARGGEDPRGVLVIGAPGGRVVDRVLVGRGWLETPTWSPDGNRVAFIIRGGYGGSGQRSASLHVYDVQTRIDSVAAHPISDTFWPSWSPDGRWLLVADWTRDRWLFVAADGSEEHEYPWLGDMPRWCCPSSPPISVQIPVC